MSIVVAGAGAKTTLSNDRRYRAIFESVVDFAIIATDRTGQVTEWNTGAEHILGWSCEEMCGERVERIFTPEDTALGRAETEMRLSMEIGRASDERWHLRKDGKRFWASGEMMPLLDEAGFHQGFVKVLRDRTGEHELGKALADTEERLRAIVTASSDALYSMSADWVEMRQLTSGGFLADQTTGNANWRDDYIPLDERPLVNAAIAEAIQTKGLFSLEHRVKQADGQIGWTVSKAVPLLDDQGNITEWFGAASDITARRTAENDLRDLTASLEDERERLAQMFEQAPTFMAMLRGPDHRIERVNQGYVRLIGAREVVGLTFAEALPDAVEQGFLQLLDGVYRSGKPFCANGSRYAVQSSTDGPINERFVDFVYQPLRDAAGVVAGIFVEGADVTERMRVEQSLRESEEFNRRVLASSTDCIKVLDLDGNLAFVSEGGMAAMEISDFNRIEGCPWPNWWEGQGHADAEAALETASRSLKKASRFGMSVIHSACISGGVPGARTG